MTPLTKKDRLALYGGSFNPPTLDHFYALFQLAEAEPPLPCVVVVPCGPRNDKPGTDEISSQHRRVMCSLAFGGVPNVTLDLDDLDQERFTPLYALEERYAAVHSGVEFWHVVGSDLIQNGRFGSAPMQRWARARHIWAKCRFMVLPRHGYPVNSADLPPNSAVAPGPMTLDSSRAGSSTDVRQRIRLGESILDSVDLGVAYYIREHGLYLGQKK